jgi:hypothetical protein
LFLERSGFVEETYHTFSYSPLRGDDGTVAGMLCVVSEDTARVISERRMTTLLDLGSEPTALRSEEEVFAFAARCLEDNGRDFPFALLYRFDAASGRADLAAAAGWPRATPSPRQCWTRRTPPPSGRPRMRPPVGSR